MNKTIDAQVMCPYYFGEDKAFVTCEGLIDGTRVKSQFRTTAEKREFMSRHCLECFGRGCAIADFLNRKYG